MGSRIRVLPAIILIAGAISLAPTARAASQTLPVQCAANDDRVWVYDSLTSFTVVLKLKCGADVEILDRAKGYVKVRTAEGKEGYVPEAAFPSLPPYADPNTTPAEGLAAVVRARRLAAHPASAVQEPPVPPAPAPVVANAAPVPAVVAAAPATLEAKPAEAPVTVAAIVAPAPVSVNATTPHAVATAAPIASTRAAAAANVKPVSAAPKKKAPTAARANAPQPAETRSTATPAAAAQTTSLHSNSPRGADRNSLQVVTLASGPAKAAPRMEPVADKTTLEVDLDSRQPSAPAALRPATVTSAAESEDVPEDQPDDQSADPSCRIFFAAYGLSPSQARWFEQARRKRYADICPAPSPAKVDVVMIFTHDVDIFNSTMPDAVHVDKNGFSDFDPISPVDTAVMTQAAADKAHHQFVWVFEMKRGAFDPAKFSPRRRPQFTKSEVNSLTASHAADRSVEDAFEYVQGQGSAR